MRESNNWTSLCITLRTASYLAVLYNIGVFAANFIIYVKDRSSWRDDSNTEWVRWQWIDLSISGVSILAAMMLYIAIIKRNHRLLQVVLIWTVVCIVLSIVVLGFGFGELERAQIVARCVGIVVSAYFADVIFSYYLKLRRSMPVESRKRAHRQSFTLEPSPQDCPPSDICNGGFHDDNAVSMTEPHNNIRNVQLWYQDTKM